MKLPFDENISHKLPILLEDIFSGSVHVRNIGRLQAIRMFGNMLKITG